MGPMPAPEPVQPAVVPVACRPNSSLRPLESKWAKKSMVVVYRDYIYIYSFSLCRNLTIITLINLYNKRWLDVNAVIVDFFLLLGASECRFFWLVHEALPGHGGDSDVIPFFQASWFPHLFSSNVAWIVLFGRCILNFLRSNSFFPFLLGTDELYTECDTSLFHVYFPCS